MFADFLLALKPLGEDLVAVHLGMGKLDGYGPSCLEVGRAINRGHVGCGKQHCQSVMIELVAGF